MNNAKSPASGILTAAAVIAALLITVAAPLWALSMINTMFDFRSPLKDTAPLPGSALNHPVSRQMVFVLIDALRLDTSLNPDIMPNLNRLRQQGASAISHSRPLSYSQPGYTTLLTGAWPEINDGPAANLDYAEIRMFTQDDLFSAVHRAGMKTAVSGYNWFEKLIPQTSVDARFYTAGEDEKADRDVVDAALPWLGKDYSLVLIHIDQVDYAGHHQGGPVSSSWGSAARRADDLVGEILSHLDLAKDTILVTSDHGQIDAGGHGGNEPVELTEPLILAGAGIKPGAYPDTFMVDIAPTLAALLGSNLPASTQGRTLVEMLNLSPVVLQNLPAAVSAQQTQLVTTYTKAIGQAIPAGGLPTDNQVASYQAALDRSVAARQNSERLPRWLILVVFMLLAVAVSSRFSRQTLVWVYAGALVSVLLVHLRVRILDGHAYSLAWVPGQMELILYIANTTAAATLMGWMVTIFGLRAFRQGSAGASQLTLGYLSAVCVLLMIPIGVSFAINGPVTTWTLPDLNTYFLGFLCLVQAAVGVLVGLLLTGLAVLITRFTIHRSAKTERLAP